MLNGPRERHAPPRGRPGLARFGRSLLPFEDLRGIRSAGRRRSGSLDGPLFKRPTFGEAPPPAGGAAAIVLDNVTVVDVDRGGLVAARRVVIVGPRIRAIGAPDSVRIPPGARVVDAAGKYLIPGLWDMHIHPGRYTSIFYPLLLANGVTGIRDAWSSVPLDTLQQWRRAILAGWRVGPPRQILSGVAIDEGIGCDPAAPARLAGHVCVSPGDSAAARRLVGRLKAAGADMLKTYSLSAEMYFVIAAEARRLGIPFGGHVAAQADGPTAEQAADSGARMIDHLRFDNPWYSSGVFLRGLTNLTARCLAHGLARDTAKSEPCRSAAREFRRRGAWVVMDEVVYPLRRYAGHEAFWAGGPLPIRWLRDSVGAYTDSAGAMRLMEEVDFPVLPGTDLGSLAVLGAQQIPGFFLHANLMTYAMAGMTAPTVLKSATLNPARALHATDSLGTVEVGKLADLVVLDANPLADVANLTAIRAVVANGRYYDRVALDRLLAEGRANWRRAYAAAADSGLMEP